MNNTAKIISIQERRIEDVAGRYKELKEQEAKIKKELELIRADLLSFVPDDSTATAGKYTIIHTTTQKRSLDTKTLKKELPELWNEYGQDSTSHTIKVV